MRIPAATVVALTLVLGLLAGCAASKPQAVGTSEAPPASAIVDEAAESFGTISGFVVDDEEVPIPDATVGLLKLSVEVRSDATGAFEFTKVPAGGYDIVVGRLGYDSVLRRIDVKDGETTEITLVLKPIARLVPYPEVFQHNLIHHYGQVYLDFAFWTVGQDGGCESCIWNFTTRGIPRTILIEVVGEHLLDSPAMPPGEQIYFFSGPDLMVNANFPLPVRLEITNEQVNNQTEFQVNSFCDHFWFCYEERREAWITAFHDMDMPKEYSALPK